MEQRLGYEASCRRLQPDYLEPGILPPMPERRPLASDSEPLGVSFFRTFVGEGDDLSNLTLPRTFFCRSEINDASFRNTDLAESTLCWNDFVDVDFSGAVLADADLRASNFERVNFRGADLQRADMRRSAFVECVFEGANLRGAVFTRKQGTVLGLTDVQRLEKAWTDDDGPEPEE